MTEEKRICTKCILHSKVPQVTINDEGLCIFCEIANHVTDDMVQQNTQLLKTKMDSILKEAKEKKRPYDVLVYFSGGKDSTYVLNLMKNKYNMNVLAYSMIQPYVTDVAKDNMEEITKKMGVEAIKFFMDEQVFKKVMRYSLLHSEKYGLTEWVGCEICGFLTKWVGIKLAISLGIPLVVDGMDNAQSGGGGIRDAEQIKMKMKNGMKPFGRVHELINDALGEDYKHSIYGFNHDVLLNSEYPSALSPLCFHTYDPTYSFKQLESMGISYKQFKSLNTNCELLYLLDYISMRRYDCDSYIKLYASGLRQNYDTIEQLELDQKAHKKQLTREDMIRLLDEYKAVLYYIIDNDINENSVSPEDRGTLMDLIRFSSRMFGESTINKLLDRAVKLKYHADYFEIDLKALN